MKSKKGFTLIELLVVIAIIGILAAIVLVSLRGASGRAKDARIKADLNQVRTQAELMAAETGSNGYDDLCAATNDGLAGPSGTSYATNLATLQSDIGEQQGTLDLVCYDDTEHYCVSATLNSTASGGAAQYFCIDSSGRVKINTSTRVCAVGNIACE